MYIYQLDNSIQYIPVHLNAVFKSKYLSFSYDLIDEALAAEMYDNIKSSDDKFFLLDLSRIKAAHSRVFEEYAKLAGENKHLIFVHVDDILRGHLNQTIKNVVNEDTSVFTTIEARDFYLKFFETSPGPELNLQKQVTSVIAKHLLNTATKKDVFLDSSNIYSNMYVDIKQLFYEPKTFILSIYLLCNKISEYATIKHFDGFICASNNGSVIATSLSLLLNKASLHLMNLGPHLTIMDREIIDKICKDKVYLFIYDFICLGTELKLVKTLATLRGAKVNASFGIASHKLPSRVDPPRRYDTNISSLFSINDDFDFNYTVSID